MNPTGIAQEDSPLPLSAVLSQNYPNPFNPTTKITFTLSSQERDGVRLPVTLRVYDMLGREIATLVNEELKPGSYAVTFHANEIAGGMYFYRLASGNEPKFGRWC